MNLSCFTIAPLQQREKGICIRICTVILARFYFPLCGLFSSTFRFIREGNKNLSIQKYYVHTEILCTFTLLFLIRVYLKPCFMLELWTRTFPKVYRNVYCPPHLCYHYCLILLQYTEQVFHKRELFIDAPGEIWKYRWNYPI